MPNPARRTIALAALAAAIIAGAVALDLAPAAAQSDDETGRIVAQRLADGRTEFGWQPAGAARVLPHARYFPANAQVGRWLNSSPVEVGGAEIGRINARLRSDGRIEFGFTPTDGERILPQSRYFPVDARAGRWLRSTTIDISAQTTPPPPVSSTGFTAVSAGSVYTCAIRESGAIACWGRNSSGQADAPAGRFSAVSAGESHTCAIRAGNGAIECWGNNNDDRTDAPAGRFSAVSAGESHTCAIRAGSGAIECWGSKRDGRSSPPTGRFSAVATGRRHGCGLRESGAIECWGWISRATDAPAGRFSAVSAGRDTDYTCAIRAGTGAIVCWGRNYERGRTDAPAGRFSAIDRGCAIRAGNGAIECWGSNNYGLSTPTVGRFSAVSVGASHSCGLRESGAIECWGRNSSGQAEPPAGSFSAVSVGFSANSRYLQICAIRAERGAIVCWGGSDAPPTGSFSALDAGDEHACALRAAGAILCWGSNDDGQTDAPAGRFTAVSAGHRHSCGLRDDGAIECWGSDDYGASIPPPGSFTAASAGIPCNCSHMQVQVLDLLPETHV